MKQIGEYRVLRELGRGGMGAVYEAEERLSRRPVALKVMHGNIAASERGRSLFVGEMGILGRLDHPNVVRLLACLEDAGQLVMVLELLRGETLRQSLKRMGRLGWVDAVIVTRQILAGLAAAHEQEPPVVHRDLKPENVMVTEEAVVKVMDFGIAKVLQDAAPATADVGTLQYMAPEQIDGTVIDARTDLYAMGLVLYEMLTGAPPFQSTSTRALLDAQCTAPVPPLPPELQQSVPADLREIMHLFLAKSAAGRPGSARAALQMLSSLQGVAPALSFRPVQAPLPPPQTGSQAGPGLNPPTGGGQVGSQWDVSEPGSNPAGPAGGLTGGGPAGSFPGASQWLASQPGVGGGVPGGSHAGIPMHGLAGAAPPVQGPPMQPRPMHGQAVAAHPMSTARHHAGGAASPAAAWNSSSAAAQSKSSALPWVLVSVLVLVVLAGGAAWALLGDSSDASASASSSAASSSAAEKAPVAAPPIADTPVTPTPTPSAVTVIPEPTTAPDKPKGPPSYPADFEAAVQQACNGGAVFNPMIPHSLVDVHDIDSDGVEDVMVDILHVGDPVRISLVALSGATMTPLWSGEVEDFNSNVRRYGHADSVLLQSFGRTMRALDLETGKPRWEQGLSDDVFWFVAEGPLVQVATIDGQFSTLAIADGTLTAGTTPPAHLKKPDDDDFPEIEGLRFEGPIGTKVCDYTQGAGLLCPRTEPYALYEKTPGTPVAHIVRYHGSKTVWDHELADFRDLRGDVLAAVSGTQIVAVAYGSDTMGATVLSASRGEPQWQRTWKRKHSAQSIMAAKDRVYVLAGCVLALDLRDGHLLNHYR